MSWYIKVLKNYAKFDGRAQRAEFWYFVLFNILISFAIGFVAGILAVSNESLGKIAGVAGNLYSLGVLIPSIAVGVRRMHDTNHSGWWYILPIVNLIFACTDSDPGPNRFGPNPKLVPSMA